MFFFTVRILSLLFIKNINMKQIIECVPNISEGRDANKIRIISSIVEEIDGVKLTQC